MLVQDAKQTHPRPATGEATVAAPRPAGTAPALARLSAGQKSALVVVAALLVGLPAVTSSAYLVGVLTVALIYAIWAMSFDCFSGLSGRENFGHSLFIGVGAYAAGYCSGVYGWNPWLGFPLGIALAVAAGVILGFPTLR